jgi:HEAT repeats
MPTPTSFRRTVRELLGLGCCILLGCGVNAQTEAPPSDQCIYEASPANVAKAIAKVKSGDFVGADVDMIGRGGAVEAIPLLEQHFHRILVAPGRPKNPEDLSKLLDKAKIAQVLVKLGDRDDTYWDFLVKLATPAIESDAPDFMNSAADEKSSPGPSPAFIAWANARHVPPNGPDGTAAEDSVYIFPGEVMLLGGTGDPRAIPLLRRALSSPNHMIEIAAANGLAELQDKSSIPLIIEACQRAPAQAASVIAEPLVYFDDSDAQRAVDQYVPKEKAKLVRDAKAHGQKTPWAYWCK